MLTIDFLKQIANNSSTEHAQNYDELIENIETLEKAARDFYGIYLSAKLKKTMREYGERDSDIHIVSHAKSGTTLTQMLLYQITTNGNVDFDHIMTCRRGSDIVYRSISQCRSQKDADCSNHMKSMM